MFALFGRGPLHENHQKSKANDDTLSQRSGVWVSEIMKILGNQLTWNLSVLRFSERENYDQRADIASWTGWRDAR